MKKFIFLCAALLIVCISIASAQVNPGDIKIPTEASNWLIAFYNAHVWVAYVIIAWGIVSEILGAIPSIKANSTYQLIFGWINWLFGLFKPAK